jgi:RND family efflux transporter MFP subunit
MTRTAAWRLPRSFSIAGAAAGIALFAAACSRPAPPVQAPQLVLAQRPVPTQADAVRVYPGDIEARFSSALSFRVDGRIVSRTAHLGEHVMAGQLLATLDPEDSDARLRAAQAALLAAESRFALAREQHERNDRQAQEDLVSRDEQQQSASAFEVAQADVQQRRAELALARSDLGHSELRADHDGDITSENAEVGMVVKAGQPVLGLAWSGERDAVIDVPEGRQAPLARGLPAQVRLVAADAPPLKARVRDVAAAADPQSRTYRVRLAIEEPGRAALGATVEVAFAAPAARAAPPGLAIPASALFHDGQAPAVWVIDPKEHRLTLRTVQVAQFHADSVTLAAGLGPDELIVAQGVHAVSAGQQVTIAPAGAAGSRP